MEVPVPVEVTAPGFLVSVHVPEEGRPLRATLPVGTAQVGWVLVPTTGAAGASGDSINYNISLLQEKRILRHW